MSYKSNSLDYTVFFFMIYLKSLSFEIKACGWFFSCFSFSVACVHRLSGVCSSPNIDETLPFHRYWEDFHACATTALADCQEGATELWEKLKKQSRNLEFKGSLFELCAGGNDASTPSVSLSGLPLLLSSISTLLTWIQF